MMRGMRAATLTADVESKDGLDVAMDARRHMAQTEAGQFDAILAYLDAAGAEPVAQKAGTNGWTRYGGSGTPQVSEFVVAEIGPALGMSADGGRGLGADILDMAYRAPKVVAGLRGGAVGARGGRRGGSGEREATRARAG